MALMFSFFESIVRKGPGSEASTLKALSMLDGLPPRQQEVLRLRFQAGLTYKEIQRVTGHSLGNVGYLIHVGIRTLRERLAGDALEEVAS